MSILALISDVHANLEALQACLAHARGQGAGRFAFLGDLVDSGADPQAVVDLVRQHVDDGALAVLGNHDAQPDAWTRLRLSREALTWLSSLPLCIREGSRCFVHASAADPELWQYLDHPVAAAESALASGASWTFSGHAHRQALFYETSPGRMAEFRPAPGVTLPVRRRRKWVALVGSVGQPRSAAYALFDDRREQLVFHRVPYDHAAAARKVRAAGLPEVLR